MVVRRRSADASPQRSHASSPGRCRPRPWPASSHRSAPVSPLRRPTTSAVLRSLRRSDALLDVRPLAVALSRAVEPGAEPRLAEPHGPPTPLSLHRRLIGALALGALGCAPAAARQGAGGPPTPKTAGGAGSPAAAATAAGAAGKTPLKPFAELTKDATARPGFFDTYEKEGRVYLAVPKGRLSEDFLLSFQLAQGIGSRGIFSGTMMSLFEPAVVALEQHGDRIYLVQKPMHYRAAPGSPTEKAVKLSFGSSVLDGAKVESVRPGADSAALIDVTDW